MPGRGVVRPEEPTIAAPKLELLQTPDYPSIWAALARAVRNPLGTDTGIPKSWSS